MDDFKNSIFPKGSDEENKNDSYAQEESGGAFEYKGDSAKEAESVEPTIQEDRINTDEYSGYIVEENAAHVPEESYHDLDYDCGCDEEQKSEVEDQPENAYDRSEYSFRRDDIPYRSYLDANFHSEKEDPAPKTYYAPPEKSKKPEKKKRGGMAKFIAACLVCAILGGLGGGAIVASRIPDGSTQGSGNSSLNIAEGEQSPAPNPATISTGEKLAGYEIYALGCEQAVGISTEITYRNYFGMESTTAVSGSGFIVTENGYIVTNYHVVQTAHEGGYKISVMLFNGETYDAEIIGFEKDSDLAVLKIDASGLSAATLGSSDNLLVGETVYAIGNPLGELSFSMTTGSVSALNREIMTTDSTTGRTITNRMFQIDAAVNEGNSGGPVYNDKGEVVGIVTAKYSETGVEGLGFAIPIDDVLAMIEDLIDYGYVTGKPSFGIVASTYNKVMASYHDTVEGAYVESVNEGSCSATAGLRVGDVITKLDDTAITSLEELLSIKRNYRSGDKVTLTVYRDGDYQELELIFDEESTSASSGDSANTNTDKDMLQPVPKGGDQGEQ